MTWIIIILIVGYILFHFLKDLNKDNQDLKNQNIYEKFKVLADNINQNAYQGQGNIRMHPNDKRSFHIYKPNAPQIIEFQYGTGHLTIIWRYKYLGDNEIVYEETLRNVRDISDEEQNTVSKQIISEMNRRIDKVMTQTHGFSPINKVNIDNVVKEAAKYEDDELAPYEQERAKVIFKILQSIKTNPNLITDFSESKFQEMIDKVFALEAFKYGMWRLKDKTLANGYFQNPAYIKANKDKFISDFNSKINSGYFLDFDEKDVNVYFLNWILKFRDDAITINNFFSGK